MDKNKLTKRQKSILDYILKFSEINNYPPTLKEIAEHFNLTIGTIQDHIYALQRKRFLEKRPDTARGLKVVKSGTGDPIKQKTEFDYIPLYGSVAAGEPIFASDNIQGYVAIEKISRGHHLHFALRVKGDSMIDSGIYNGDIVIVRKQDSADDGDIVIALLDDEATVKTLRNSRIKAYLEASNSRYKAIINKPFRIIGKVIELRREYLNA